MANTLSNNVSESSVFAFTFASPKTGLTKFHVRSNISNFVSPTDAVVYVGPAAVGGVHFGKIYYISTPKSLPFKASHSITNYIKAVKAMTGTGNNPAWYNTVTIQCPVDVEVYDGSNNLVGKIVNNKVDASTTIPAYVEGDDKYFFFPKDEQRTVKIVATGAGAMDFTVTDVNAQTEEVVAGKTFNDVPLTNGKKFSSNVSGNIGATSVRLYGLNSGGSIQEEYEGVTATDSLMRNSYIELAVKDDGLYTIGTSGGNPNIPTDNDKKLLYGHPSPSTSYTTIVVDGNVNKYGVSGLSGKPVFNTANQSNVSVSTYGKIEVKQTLRITNNSATDRPDVVEIRYDITNTDTVAHNVGARIMLDTMLGSNDYAPFRLPGYGNLTTQTEFAGNQIPQYWQAFDSLDNPTVVSQGSFLRSGVNPPDKVQFTNWNRVNSNPWNEPVSPGVENGDSAVTITWDQKSLAAGQTKTYITHYGVGELISNLQPPISVSISGDGMVTVTDGYVYLPLEITAYWKNISNVTANNVYARINLGPGLALAGSQSAQQNVPSLVPGAEQQIAWRINVLPSATEFTTYVEIVVGADGVAPKTLRKNIVVPANNGMQTQPTTYAVTFNANGGSGGPISQIKTQGAPLKLSEATPTRSGFKFTGWATSSSGAVAYQPGDNYTANAAVTLYSVWKAPEALSLNTAKAVNITTGGQLEYFTFTPTTSGIHEFYSTGSYDTYGYLYDTNWNQIASDDDSGDDRNFKISYNLTAGTIYYFGAKMYSSSSTGSFSVTLTRPGTTPNTYVLSVVSGSGSGNYAAGAVVNITASAAPSGKVFDKWTTTSTGAIANPTSASTTFTMPAGAATVTATYKAAVNPVKTIFSTKYPSTIWNWIMFFLLFGWIWMWF